VDDVRPGTFVSVKVHFGFGSGDPDTAGQEAIIIDESVRSSLQV
jgi:hypothetical protein